MINNLLRQLPRTLTTTSMFNYHIPPQHSQTHHHPGLTAKRIIRAVHKTLNEQDPDRWNGVPISFKTHWKDQAGHTDVELCTYIHEAIEREFGIEVKDRHLLIADVQTAYWVVTQSHDAL